MDQAFRLVAMVSTCSLAAIIGLNNVSADEIEDCGANETLVDNECVCKKCYIRGEDGECTECDEGCYETVVDGQKYCRETSEVAAINSAKKAQMQAGDGLEGLEQITEADMFRSQSVFDAPGSKLRNPDQFRPDEDVPGVYPNFNNYTNVEYTHLDDVKNSNLQASLNANDLLPYLSEQKAIHLNRYDRHINTRHSELFGVEGGLHSTFTPPDDTSRSRSVQADKQFGYSDYDRTVHQSIPDPQWPHIYGLNVTDSSADYAANSMGMNINYPEAQLTTYAHGDVMTGYKPITSIMRPLTQPVLTNRLDEREVTYINSADNFVKKGPLPFDEFESRKHQGEDLARIPYANTGSLQPTVVRGKQPEIDVGDAKELWQVGNKYYPITSEYRSRRDMEYKNKEEPIIPDTKGHGFYGSVIDPLQNVANKDQFFYATNKIATDIDYASIREHSDRQTRDDERVIALPRLSHAQEEVSFARSTPQRNTSNKTQSNHDGHRLNSDRMAFIQPPSRYEDIDVSNNRYLFESYQTPLHAMPSNLDRNDLVAIGPATI
tara:strand:+ start:5 stop:1648 length:1644 start_codon:yes stop_codon:yes gene_type:complete